MEVKLEQKVKVELNDQEQMEDKSVVEKLEVKMLMTDSVVQAVESGPIVLAMVDPITGFCHGIADIAKVEEHVERRATIAGGKRKKYHCDSCNYSTKDKYMITRHIARIHEKTLESKQCRFCKFSTIYPSNLTRHIHRAHSIQDSSDSCNQVSKCNPSFD